MYLTVINIRYKIIFFVSLIPYPTSLPVIIMYVSMKQQFITQPRKNCRLTKNSLVITINKVGITLTPISIPRVLEQPFRTDWFDYNDNSGKLLYPKSPLLGTKRLLSSILRINYPNVLINFALVIILAHNLTILKQF